MTRGRVTANVSANVISPSREASYELRLSNYCVPNSRRRPNALKREKLLRDPDKPIGYEQAKADLEAAHPSATLGREGGKGLAAAQVAGGAKVAVMPLRNDVEAARAEFCRMPTEIESFAGRRKVIETLLEKVLYADGKAEIHCHLPLAAAENHNQRVRGNCDFSGSIPFVINCSVPQRRRRVA